MNNKQLAGVLNDALEIGFDYHKKGVAEDLISDWRDSRKHEKLGKYLGDNWMVHSEEFSTTGAAEDRDVEANKSEFARWVERLSWADGNEEFHDELAEISRFLRYDVSINCFKDNRVQVDKNPKSGKKINAGMKLSKALSRFLDIKEKDKAKQQALTTEVQNKYSTYRQTTASSGMGKLTLSMHPFDYITISDNNHRWSSCHSFMGGDFRVGNLNYMVDEVTLVAYFSSEDSFAPLNALGNLEWNSKRWRVLVHLNKGDNGDWRVLYNEQYPFEDNELLKRLDELVMNTFGIDEESTILLSQDMMEDKYGQYFGNFYDVSDNYTGYFDMDNTDGGYVRLERQLLNYEGVIRDPMVIGDAIPCLVCGCDVAEDAYNGGCMSCSGNWYCEECGGSYYEEDMVYSAIADRSLCFDCYDYLYFNCEHCGIEHTHEEGIYLPFLFTTICPDCYVDLVKGGVEMMIINNRLFELKRKGKINSKEELKEINKKHIKSLSDKINNRLLTTEIVNSEDSQYSYNQSMDDMFLHKTRGVHERFSAKFFERNFRAVCGDFKDDFRITKIHFAGVYDGEEELEEIMEQVKNAIMYNDVFEGVEIDTTKAYIM